MLFRSQALARIFVGEFINETQSTATEDEAFDALMAAADPILGTARELRAKAAAYADSARKLNDERQVIDAIKDKADANGHTALMRASLDGHLEVAQLLCEAGADKDKADQDGDTALMLASDNGHLEVARLLCESNSEREGEGAEARSFKRPSAKPRSCVATHPQETTEGRQIGRAHV